MTGGRSNSAHKGYIGVYQGGGGVQIVKNGLDDHPHG